MKTLFRIIYVSCMVSVLVACDGFGLQKNYKYRSKPLDPHVGMNALEYIQSREDLSQMAKAIAYCSMEELYTQEQDYFTYLCINNEGMDNFVKSKGFEVGADITEVEVDAVSKMLQYHIVVGEYHAYGMKLPVEPVYVKNHLEGEWGLMTIKVNKSSQNSIGHPISNGNIVINEAGSNFSSKRISSVASNIMPVNGAIHIFNDFARFSKGVNYTPAY
ncbi:MAG: hypothetical protein NC115_01550 [Bacteroidales bacterium]|nr:hypothetical protein [Bacteroidales bacterium]